MIYVSSDLHGCKLSDFQQLLNKADFQDDDFLFILGDVVDRGEWGAELLLWLTQQPNMQLILGNHEALMLTCSFLFDELNDQSLDSLTTKEIALIQNWMENGGTPTIKGFQKLMKKDPDLVYGILDYLHDAPLYEELEVNGKKFILVHSGLGNFNADRPLDNYSPEELLLERPTLESRYFYDATVIFGHTPSQFFGEEYIGKAAHAASWICVDTGVSLGNTPMLLRLDDMREFYLQ